MYPFSAATTAHTVAIEGGPTVFAMCAVDALGIADMLGTDVTITSTVLRRNDFFTSTDTADAWLAAHPHVSGVVLAKE